MSFDFDTLEPLILDILSAPGIDLQTISAKSVRHELPNLNPSLTAQFLKKNKKAVNTVIARVYERVSSERPEGSRSADETEVTARKRKSEDGDDDEDHEEDGGEGEEEDEEVKPPLPKKAKKAGRTELSDAELARRLNDEINSRSRRSGTTPRRGNTNGAGKRGNKAKKSSATVDTDEESGGEDGGTKPKKRSGGSAKGGFAKEYALSEPLAALLNIDKLSRPQVVKQLWNYIKLHELQNPENKKEIVCDVNFKSVFGVDKIDMFRMNKVLGQHLHESGV